MGAEEAGAAQAWQAPEASGRPLASPAANVKAAAAGSGLATASQLVDLQKAAYDEAYAVGLAEGKTAGEHQQRERVERLDLLLADLARPFEKLDEEVEVEVVGLALALAKQLLRRELRVDPTQVIPIVREAISVLPVSVRDVRVHLHPEDAAIIRQYLAPTENERAWQIVEDPVMMRGGCQVVTPVSRVDARLETRLGKLLTELLGDQRGAEVRPPAEPA